MTVLDRLFGPRVMCVKCGEQFRERDRQPCRMCGATGRLVGRFAKEGMTTKDKAR